MVIVIKRKRFNLSTKIWIDKCYISKIHHIGIVESEGRSSKNKFVTKKIVLQSTGVQGEEEVLQLVDWIGGREVENITLRISKHE